MLAAVSGMCVSATAGSARAWWIAGAVAGVVINAFAGVAQTSRLTVASAAREDRQIEMNDILDPMVRKVGDIVGESSAAERKRLQSELMATALTGVTGLVGPDRVRVCWFVLSARPDGRRQLSSSNSLGRSGAVRTIFVGGTPAGDAALALIDTNDTRFCRDVEDVPPPDGCQIPPGSTAPSSACLSLPQESALGC